MSENFSRIRENEKNNPMGVEVKAAANFENIEELLVEVMRVEREAWPEEVQATQEKFESRLALFPEGFFLAFADGQLGGVSTSEIIRLDSARSLASWEEATDDGFIELTHDKYGNALYVVSVGVSKLVQGKGLGSALVEAQKDLARRKGLDFLVLGARLSGYRNFHSSHPQISAEQYVRMKNDEGEALDPEVRFYERRGLEVERVVSNYMEDDPESESYGVVMVWKNR